MVVVESDTDRNKEKRRAFTIMGVRVSLKLLCFDSK